MDAMQIIRLANPQDVNRTLATVLTELIGQDDIEMVFEYHDPRAPRTHAELAERFGIDRTNVGRRIRAAMTTLRRHGLLPNEWREQRAEQHATHGKAS